jgi:hypothetical protein
MASRQSSNGIESASRRHRLATAAADRRSRLTSRACSASAVNADATVRFANRRATRFILESLAFSALDESAASIQAANAEAILTRRMRCTTRRKIALFAVSVSIHWTHSSNGVDSCSLRQRVTNFASLYRWDLVTAARWTQALNAADVDRIAIRLKNRSVLDIKRRRRLDSDHASRHVANAAAVFAVRIRCTNLRSFVRLPLTSSTHSTQSLNGAASCSRCHRVTIF